MVDDCALGDLLLDPVSVRCGDERKAMKGEVVVVGGGGEQMEDRAVHRETTKGERGRKWNQRMRAKKGMRKRRLCRGA